MTATQIPLAAIRNINPTWPRRSTVLGDQQQKADYVPERHRSTKLRGEEPDGTKFLARPELAQNGIDENSNGKFCSDHQPDANDGDDIQKNPHNELLSLRLSAAIE